MKYFKPELLVRCRSRDDDESEAAAAEWEQANAAYKAHLRTIRRRLPAAARRLLSRYTLHDAKVLSIAFADTPPLVTLLVKLDGTLAQPGDVLQLTYLVVTGRHAGVSFKTHSHFPEATSPPWVLYDEFGLDEQGGFFTHALLLTDGHEIEIRFHHLRVRRLAEVLTGRLEVAEGERTWPLVGA